MLITIRIKNVTLINSYTIFSIGGVLSSSLSVQNECTWSQLANNLLVMVVRGLSRANLLLMVSQSFLLLMFLNSGLIQ